MYINPWRNINSQRLSSLSPASLCSGISSALNRSEERCETTTSSAQRAINGSGPQDITGGQVLGSSDTGRLQKPIYQRVDDSSTELNIFQTHESRSYENTNVIKTLSYRTHCWQSNIRLIDLFLATTTFSCRVSGVNVNSLTHIRPSLDQGQEPKGSMHADAKLYISFLFQNGINKFIPWMLMHVKDIQELNKTTEDYNAK